MTKLVKVSVGVAFLTAVVAVLIVGATGLPAVGGLTKQRAVAAIVNAGQAAEAQVAVTVTELPLQKTEGPFKASGVGEAGIKSGVLATPLDVTVTRTTGRLRSLFRDIGYEIDGVRTHGEVPRLFLTSLLEDLRQQPRADLRKTIFIKSTLPLILRANELILQDRGRLTSLRNQVIDGELLSEQDRLWLNKMADSYGSKTASPADLLTHVDIIPPSLAIAQSAEESGWGTSRFAREGNALFGQRVYKAHQKGLVPKGLPEGASFRIRAFDHLIDGVKSYAHNLNSHPAYRDFREARADMRTEKASISGYSLAGTLTRYSERGADYIKALRVIMRVNTLSSFDDAKLDGSSAPDV